MIRTQTSMWYLVSLFLFMTFISRGSPFSTNNNDKLNVSHQNNKVKSPDSSRRTFIESEIPLVIATSSVVATSTFNIPSATVANANAVTDRATTTLVSSPILNLPHDPLIKIPRVGYSLYKTDVSMVEQCMNLALHAGVRHFDVASLYGSNAIVGQVLKSYCQYGLPDIDNKGFSVSNSITTTATTKKGFLQTSFANFSSPNQRRKELFITHKISNSDQDSSIEKVQNNVMNELNNNLQLSYLDMAMIHSPLTDSAKRLGTYRAMLDLKKRGIVKCIGVCNYGVEALDEIVMHELPPPDVIQLQLSPFNQHKDVVAWASKYGSVLSCAAWSKLSSVNGPQEGWAILADIAKNKNMTKAQVLVRWAFQKGYLSVPRSGAGSKLERIAIQENSYQGVKGYILTETEMEILDGLDEQLKVGRLGVLDGFDEGDIAGPDWDPTVAKLRI